MNKDQALLELETVLHMCFLFTHLNEGFGNYSKQECQEISDRYKETYQYIKEHLT